MGVSKSTVGVSKNVFDMMGSKVIYAEQGKATVVMFPSPAMQNYLGFLHGGLHYHLSDQAMKAAIGGQIYLLDARVDYLKQVRDGECRVEAEILKEGRNIVNAVARIYSGGQLAGFANGVYSRNAPGEMSASQAVGGDRPVKPNAENCVFLSKKHPGFSGDDILIRQITAAQKFWKEQLNTGGRHAIALDMEPAFLTPEGRVIEPLFAILSDDVIGLSCASANLRVVTCSLSCRFFGVPIKPQRLTACGQIDGVNGKGVFVTGWAWADDTLVSSFSATSFCMGKLTDPLPPRKNSWNPLADLS
jgi:uncharacterized protein (TIGR00369 family)